MRSKLLLAIAALLLSLSSVAASLAERSPFTQGHWWDPTRAGSGFDFFSVGDQSMLVWYTYDETGRPTWYTAQGTLGANASWPLLRHAWRDGRKAGYEVVGTARPTIENTDSIVLAWDIGGRTGQSRLQPFIVSGVMNEVDYTGSWFDPANSGWGLAVTHQGDVLGGVVFTYDANGAPTWAAGFGREKASAELYTFTGACPWCAYAPSVQRTSGRLQLQFAGDGALTVRNELPMAMAAGVGIDGARLVQLSRPASARPADRQLAHFASGDALKSYLASGAVNVRPIPSVDFSPAPPAAATPSFSTTNLQEAGVDEADRVKSDGRFVYALTQPTSAGAATSLRYAAVGPQGSSLSVRGSIQVGTSGGYYNGKQGLYLHDGKVIALTGTLPVSYYGWSISGSFMNGVTNVEILRAPDDTSLPATLWRAQIDGHLLTSRRIGDRLYLVSRFVPYIPGFGYGAGATPQNLAVLAGLRAEDLLPKARVNGGEATALLDASSIYLPRTGSSTPLADLIVVTAIDLASQRIVQALGIAGRTTTVYVSTESLYLASARRDFYGPTGAPGLTEPPGYTTDIHQVRLAGTGMAVVGSGAVEGYLGDDLEKSAFRMSEHAGKLRVVSASTTWWGAASRNRVTILEPAPAAPGLLRTVSYLPNAQRPQTLGKPGEVLYGTRFAGERLYAVTFKNIDPLYVVDLSNAADPRIAGELEMPGFSEYLHPLPNGLLLGFGKDAKPTDIRGDGNFAWYQGLQLSLFDVRDPARPREMQRVLMGKRGSDSPLLRDHHALSTLARADGTLSLAFPAQINDGPAPLSGSGDWAFYPWLESGLMRFEVQGTTAADARLVQLPSLVTHRNSGGYQYVPYPNPIAHARSVLFLSGLVYVSEDKFWHRDVAGTATGPF